jgi:hypothetical protein
LEYKPRIRVAPPQHGNEPGTWAFKTVSTRFPKTARRIFKENDFSDEIEARLRALIADIPHAAIRPIEDPGAPDNPAWSEFVTPYLGQNWHQPPWFFTEHYFYRRILEATRFFQPGDGGGVDPFLYQKRKGLEISRDSIRTLSSRVNAWLEGEPDQRVIENLLYLDLWGNQADLSLWPAEGNEKPDHTDTQAALSHILVNDASTVAEYLLTEKPHPRVDILIDNAGLELVGDLAFADYLLRSGIASNVPLHVKMHPTFVSDAMEVDVRKTIEFLCADEDLHARSVGEHLSASMTGDQLQIKGSWFWTSPLDGWEMPLAIRQDMSQASIVISKGDANYRRLLGDRHWPILTKFDDIMAYFPVPLVVLRTLKSELVVGLKEGQARVVNAQDPEWLIDGRWGMIQFTDG